MSLYDWKNLEITQLIIKELRARQAQLKEELATSAGENPLVDRFKVGAIAAYQDFLDIELEDQEKNGN